MARAPHRTAPVRLRTLQGVWLLAVCLAACGEPAREPQPEQAAVSIAFRPVVAEAIALLELRTGEDRAKAADPNHVPPEPEALDRQMRGGLAYVRNSGARVREVGMADLAAAPPEASAWLGRHALDEDAPEPERYLALEVLARRGGEADALALMDVAEGALVAGLRAGAYWRLGSLPHDGVLPRLVLRLKYETDWEAVLWLGWSLCQHGLYSGLDGLLAVARGAPDAALGAQAADEARQLAEDVGVASAEELLAMWHRGEVPPLAAPVRRSLHYQLELWRWLERLDGFQLRSVDDCRFLMARLDGVAAAVLAEALLDTSSYVRLGAAQSLARMGPRGSVAVPVLTAQLDDSELGPWMAAALGQLGVPAAREPLEARLECEGSGAMCVAAARALGHLGLAESVPALSRALAGAGDWAEWRQAVAESLVYCGAPELALDVLVRALTDPQLEPSTSAAALRHHIAREAQAGRPGAAELLVEWDRIGDEARAAVASGAPGAGERPRDSRAVSETRAALVQAWLVDR